MSGYAGLNQSRNKRQESSTSKEPLRRLPQESAAPVAGWVVFTEQISQ
jgi:hypothetical protein